jgi:hypothetical protein
MDSKLGVDPRGWERRLLDPGGAAPGSAPSMTTAVAAMALSGALDVTVGTGVGELGTGTDAGGGGAAVRPRRC